MSIHSLTYLTHDLPGIGGAIKQRPEDFLVEEQPLYDLVGEGEHLFLFIEKTNIATSDVVQRLAKAFRVRRDAVGYAGLKDKHAVTRQHFSVRLTDAGATETEAAQNLEHHPRLKLLWTTRHRNKLRRGHLAGNRFVIRIRDVKPTDVVAARRTLDHLANVGVPNYIGEQRFGYREQNHLIGRHILLGEHQKALDLMLGGPMDYETEPMQLARAAYDRGDYGEALIHWPKHLRHDRRALDLLRQGADARQALRAIGRTQLVFFISACQSAIFNRVLDHRLRLGSFNHLLVGDLAFKHDNRAVFLVEDQATADHENGPDGRVRTLDVSPSGPMWGPDMARPTGEVQRIESEALTEAGLEETNLLGTGELAAEGSRRPLRIAMRDPDISGGVDEHGAYIRVAFELPRGAFATMVLREIMKNSSVSED